MNLAVARIAKRASVSLVRASSALLGASGWRVRRLPLGDDESNEVLDEIIAACKLLAMIDATDETDPRREFLCAERLRIKASIHVTFEHEEVRVQEYKWRPEGARAKKKKEAKKDANKDAIELYTPDPELASTWTIWTELSELKREYTCGDNCEKEKKDRVGRLEAAHKDLAAQQNLTAQSDAKMLLTAKSSMKKSRENQTVHRLKAHTRTMPVFLTENEEIDFLRAENFDPPKKGDTNVQIPDVVQGGKIEGEDTRQNRENREKYFEVLVKGRQKKVEASALNANHVLDTYSIGLVGDQWQSEVGGTTADLVKATENAKRMIVEVREAIEEEEREESERKRTPKVKASALVVAVARGEQKQHWLLTYAKTIGDVWLEARGYSTVVRGHEVLVDFEKETDITPRPTTATHYVVPCVTEGARTVYHIPKTHTNGPLHTLSGGVDVSPLYDVARRSISSLRDPSSVQKFTVVLGIESSFGGAEEVERMRKFLDSNNAGMFKTGLKTLSAVVGNVGSAMRGGRKGKSAPVDADAEKNTARVAEEVEILRATMHQLSTKNDISDDKQVTTKETAESMLKHILENGAHTSQFNVKAGQWNGGMLQKALFGSANFKFDVHGTSKETINAAHSMLLLLIANKAHYLQDEIADLKKTLTLEQLKAVRDALKLVSEASDASLDEWLQFHELLTRAEVNNQDIYFFGKKVTLEHLLCHTQKMFYTSLNDFDIKHSSTLLRRALKCDWSGESVFVRHIFETMRHVCETNKDCCCLPLMLLACSDMCTDEVAEIMYFSATAECKCHTSFLAKLRDPYLEYGDDDAKDLTGVKQFLEVLVKKNLTNLLGDKKFTGGFLGAAYLELSDKTKDSDALMGKQVTFLLDPGSTQPPAQPPAVMRLAVKHGLRADTADAKSVIQKLFLFNENKTNTRESLKRIITYASAPHKDDRGILDHDSLKTFMFADEVALWQSFLKASEDNSALAELQKNVLLRTELERIMTGVGKFFREKIPTIGELLSSIRGQDETDATNLRKLICDKLPNGEKTNYYPFFDTEEGKYPQVDACEYKGLHLIEYTGKKDKDDALLSFIEGCKCNYKCLRELTARARNAPSRMPEHVKTFFKEHIFKRDILVPDKVRALKWSEAMCVNLQKVIICGSDANERQAFAAICENSTVDFDAKFKLEPSDCTDPGVTHSLTQNTELPKYATSTYKSELKDRVTKSDYVKAIEEINKVRDNRASSPKKSHVVVLAEMDRETAMQLQGLRYVHYTYIQSEKCDAGACEAYIAALVTQESGAMDMFSKTLAHDELMNMGSNSRHVADPRSRSILNTPGAVAHYWKQIANDITRETVFPQKNAPSVQEIKRMSKLLGERDDESTPKEHHYDEFTKTAASKETLHATLICLRYELVGDKSNITGLLEDITSATQTNGNTTQEGALRLEWSLGTKTFQRLLNEQPTPYLAWMLQCALQTRKGLLKSHTKTLLLSGEEGHKKPEYADSINRLLDAFERAMKNDFSSLEHLIAARKGMPRTLTKGEDNVEASELRSVALVVREILRGDDGDLRGLLDEYLNAYSDRPIRPESLQRLDITRGLSARQPSSLSNLVSGLDARTRMALSRSRTVGDAQQAYNSSFGGRIKDVILDLVKETEKRQEIPKNSRLQSAEQIDDDTPIESNPSGFVDLAFREGGLYQLLDQTRDRGKWVRVLAGTYGVEEYYAPFAFTYSARAVYTESGASATFKDKRSKNVHKGDVAYLQSISKMTRKRRSLGITVLDTRGANASVVGAMRVLAERARAASGSSSTLWRLPCEATSGASTCGSVVYVCCDFSEHDRAKKHWDVVTLVLDAELGRVLEKHVDNRFGHGERSAREIIADLRSAWDTVPQIKFEYEHVQPLVAQRHSDVKEHKGKKAKPETRTEKVKVDAPELSLLHCFRHFVEANKESEKKLVYSLFERMVLPEAAEKEKMEEKWKKAISTAIGKLRAE